MDSRLVELDAAVEGIRDARSKVYLQEAIRAYRAGALRPALTAIWVAVAYDLLAKFRELAIGGDGEAGQFVAEWDRARENSNTEKLLRLERGLLEHASAKLQLIDPIGLRELKRLVEDRHVCAHPAFSSDAELFSPTSELVRLHIVNAVQLVLSQRPVQGRSIIDEFDRDIVSDGFPHRDEKIADYFEHRYLSRTREASIISLGAVLAKSILNDTPEAWSSFKDRALSCLKALRNRRADAWPSIESTLVRLIDEIEPEKRLNALQVVAAFPGVVEKLRPETLDVIEQSVRNFDGAGEDCSFVYAIRVPRFTDAITEFVDDLDRHGLAQVLVTAAAPELWNSALGAFQRSGSFRGAEENFQSLIFPFQSSLTRANMSEVLSATIENNQIHAARDIPGLMVSLIRGMEPEQRPSNAEWTDFFQQLGHMADAGIYQQLWEYLEARGWRRPALEE